MMTKATDKELLAVFECLQKLHSAKEEAQNEPLTLSEFHFAILQECLKRDLVKI